MAGLEVPRGAYLLVGLEEVRHSLHWPFSSSKIERRAPTLLGKLVGRQRTRKLSDGCTRHRHLGDLEVIC
jgi:hypothetical protein